MEKPKLVVGWQLSWPAESHGINAALYVLCAIIASLMIRLVSCFFKSIDRRRLALTSFARKPWGSRFWQAFWSSPMLEWEKDEKPEGAPPLPPSDDDYWHAAAVGTLELLGYPVLMVMDQWAFIGAWLLFKTSGQWAAWRDRRSPFNRFLIGNALVLAFALALTKFVNFKE